MLIKARRLAGSSESGFTLIEVIVALLVVTLTSLALASLLISGARAAQLAHNHATAKDVAQARIESMRGLPYHVAFQNGPFVDVLDDYYRNVSPTSVPITPTGGVGAWVQVGAGGLNPTGPYYSVTFSPSRNPTNGAVTLPPGFSQEVDSQFLVPNTNPRQAVAAAALTSFVNAQPYDSQTTQSDQPPSLLLGVTVLTTWSEHGTSQTYRVYTEIGDSGNNGPLVLAQAGTTGLKVTGGAFDGSQLEATVGKLGLDTSLSSQSSASAIASAATATQTDFNGNTVASALGASLSAVAPPASTNGQQQMARQQSDTAEAPCGWGSFGPTQVSDVSATVSNAQPLAPADVESGTPAPSVTAALQPNGNTCGGFSFTNVLAGSQPDPALQLASGAPIISVPDATGSAAVAASHASVDTPVVTFTGSRSPVTAKTDTAFTQDIQVFPNLPLIGNRPLVKISNFSAQLSCTSGVQPTFSAPSGTLSYWTWSSSGGSYTTVNLATATTLPDPSTVVVAYSGTTPIRLSAYVASWSLGKLIQEGNATGVGLHTVPGAVSLTTAPILGASTPDSAVSVAVGDLSCVAEDYR